MSQRIRHFEADIDIDIRWQLAGAQRGADASVAAANCIRRPYEQSAAQPADVGSTARSVSSGSPSASRNSARARGTMR